MEFETLGEEERKLLMQVLDVDTNNLKCKYCNEKAEVESCGIMPPLKGGKMIITCNSPLCSMTYLVDLEEVEKQKSEVMSSCMKCGKADVKLTMCESCAKELGR